MSDITDPIDGLIRYVNEIKPFHSKIIEVLTEYVYEEAVNVTVGEDSLLDVGINIGRVDVDTGSASSSTYGGGYGDDFYDSGNDTRGLGHPDFNNSSDITGPYFPVIGINPTLDGPLDDNGQGASKLGYDIATRTIVLPGNQTATYRQDRYISLELNKHSNVSGNDTYITDASPQIESSTYVATGQTNGISDYPRTVLVLSAVIDYRPPPTGVGPTLLPTESFSFNVRLQPQSISSVVAGTGNTNTGRVRYTTILMGGSTNEPPYGIPGQPQIPRAVPPFNPTVYSTYQEGDGNYTTVDNYVTISGDQTTSYPYGSDLIMLLQNGSTVNYTVSSSYYNTTTLETTVELLQEIDPSANYANAQAIESSSGFANQYVLPTASAASIPEGLTQTVIAESIVFTWHDDIGDEVENFVQFQFGQPVPNSNTINVVSDGRTITDYLSNGDNIRVWGFDNSEDLATISNITGNTITTTTPINITISADNANNPVGFEYIDGYLEQQP